MNTVISRSCSNDNIVMASFPLLHGKRITYADVPFIFRSKSERSVEVQVYKGVWWFWCWLQIVRMTQRLNCQDKEMEKRHGIQPAQGECTCNKSFDFTWRQHSYGLNIGICECAACRKGRRGRETRTDWLNRRVLWMFRVCNWKKKTWFVQEAMPVLSVLSRFKRGVRKFRKSLLFNSKRIILYTQFSLVLGLLSAKYYCVRALAVKAEVSSIPKQT